MDNEKLVVEIVDNAKGLINIESAREKALRRSKMTRAIYLTERDAISKKVKIARQEKEKELMANPAYQTLYSMHIEYRKLLKKAVESWFGDRYRKQAEKVVEAAREYATTEFKFVANELYVPWVTDIEDIISKVRDIDYVEWPDPQNEVVIEMKILSIKDWEKKTFDELYKLVSNER